MPRAAICGFAAEGAGGACRPEGRASKEAIGFAKSRVGGAYRDRTDDLLNAIQSLSQLS